MGDALSDVPFNFDAVTDRLLVGSRPTCVADIEKLRAQSVSHILDVCMTDDSSLLPGAMAAALGISGYLFNPAPDDGQPKPVEWFQRSLRFAMPLLAQPGWILYVHCYDGVNRGPSTAYAILRAQGLSPHVARLNIDVNRPIDLVGLRYAADAEAALLHGNGADFELTRYAGNGTGWRGGGFGSTWASTL